MKTLIKIKFESNWEEEAILEFFRLYLIKMSECMQFKDVDIEVTGKNKTINRRIER